LLPRTKKAGDLYMVSEGLEDSDDSVGHDLAVLAACNHTIVSYGSFSFWGAFLAGGATVAPQHFPEYE